jgi:hypothetical protein
MKLRHLVAVVALTLSCAQWPGELPASLDRSDYVTPGAALLDVSPQQITPSCIPGGSPANAGDKWFTITNKGQGTLDYTVRVEVSGATMWLLCSPASGSCTTETDTLWLSYVTTGLGVGTYQAQVLVMSAGLDTDTVQVNLSIVDTSSPQVGLDLTVLSLSCQQGAGQIDTAFRAWNAGAGVLHFSAAADSPWVQCVVADDSSKDTADLRRVSVKVLPGALAVGSHQAHVTISPVGLAPQTVTVRLTVNALPGPSFSVSPDTLRPVCAAGKTAANQTLRLWSTGGVISISIVTPTTWIQASPAMVTSTGPTDTQNVTITYAGSDAFPSGAQKLASIILAAADSDTVTVLLNVVSGAIATSRTSMALTCAAGDSASDTLSIWSLDSTGRTVFVKSAQSSSWLWFSNATVHCSITPRRITAGCRTTGLAAGTYRDTVLLADSSGRGDTLRISVEFTVTTAVVSPVQGGQRLAFTFGYDDLDSGQTFANWLRWRTKDPQQTDAATNRYWGELVLDTTFPGGVRALPGKNPSDSELVAYRLTPAQETSFSRTDGAASSFWTSAWGNRDYAVLQLPASAFPGHASSPNDVSVELRAAAGDSGLYLCFIVADSSWVNRTSSSDREKDAISFWVDKLDLAGQALCRPGCLVPTASGYSTTKTSQVFASWFGQTAPPADFAREFYDTTTSLWRTVSVTWANADIGFGLKFEVSTIDTHHKALECLLPWRQLGIH